MPLQAGHFGESSWPGGSVMVHGIHNSGKTRLMLDALAYYSKQGKVLCANFLEENGISSGARLGLDKEDLGYQCVWNLSNEPRQGYEDFQAFIDLCVKEKPLAIGFDSLRAAYNTVLAAITGGERAPKGGDGGENEWTKAHMWMNFQMTRLRTVAKYVIVTCPSDTGQDILKRIETGIKAEPMVVPDLNGSMAQKCITWFNLVGYLMADTTKVGANYTVQRHLSFLPSKRYVTRQRMPKQIDTMIKIPNETGLWEAVLAEINRAYEHKELTV